MMKLRATQHLTQMPIPGKRVGKDESEEEELRMSFGGSGRDNSSNSADSKRNKPVKVLFEEN